MWPGAFIRLADYGEWLPTVCTDLGTIDFSSPEKGIFQSCAMTLKWHEISKQRRGVAIEATYKGRMTPSDGRVEDGFFERITRFKQLRYEDATLAENQETPAAAFGLSNTDGEYTRVVFVNINYRAADGVAPSLEESEQSEGPLNTGPPQEGNGYEVRVTLPEYSLLIFVYSHSNSILPFHPHISQHSLPLSIPYYLPPSPLSQYIFWEDDGTTCPLFKPVARSSNQSSMPALTFSGKTIVGVEAPLSKTIAGTRIVHLNLDSIIIGTLATVRPPAEVLDARVGGVYTFPHGDSQDVMWARSPAEDIRKEYVLTAIYPGLSKLAAFETLDLSSNKVVKFTKDLTMAVLAEDQSSPASRMGLTVGDIVVAKEGRSSRSARHAVGDKNKGFAVGDKVRCRDHTLHLWKPGVVTEIRPYVKVKCNKFCSGSAFTWKFVEHTADEKARQVSPLASHSSALERLCSLLLSHSSLPCLSLACPLFLIYSPLNLALALFSLSRPLLQKAASVPAEVAEYKFLYDTRTEKPLFEKRDGDGTPISALASHSALKSYRASLQTNLDLKDIFLGNMEAYEMMETTRKYEEMMAKKQQPSFQAAGTIATTIASHVITVSADAVVMTGGGDDVIDGTVFASAATAIVGDFAGTDVNDDTDGVFHATHVVGDVFVANPLAVATIDTPTLPPAPPSGPPSSLDATAAATRIQRNFKRSHSTRIKTSPAAEILPILIPLKLAKFAGKLLKKNATTPQQILDVSGCVNGFEWEWWNENLAGIAEDEARAVVEACVKLCAPPDWECTACTCTNEGAADACSVCGERKRWEC